MRGEFAHKLGGLRCTRVEALEYEPPPNESVYGGMTRLHFANGTTMTAGFWRLIKNAVPVVSIFDHRHRYGLPAPVDAIGELGREIEGKTVVTADMDHVTGDLRFTFECDVILQVFNFTGYEIWQIEFPDGALELSNYALRD